MLTYCIHHTKIYYGDYMNVLKTFSTNLKLYRNKLGLSQKALAERCGLHRTYISDIECGKRSISLDNVQKISNALGVDAYLMFIDNKTDSKEV